VREEEDSKMRGCPNFAASSVLLFECIAKPVRGTIRHIFMLTIRRMRLFSASSQLKWHAGRYRHGRHLVEAWAELHQQELLIDWKRLQSGRAALPIEPLK
jgi:hypothetical protein